MSSVPETAQRTFSLYKENPVFILNTGFLAEKEGFEPSIPFWGIHDFQSCALGQLRDFSICVTRFVPAVVASFDMIQRLYQKVKNYFPEFEMFFAASNSKVTDRESAEPSM